MINNTFSNSKIWELQNKYFNTLGVDAWIREEVPHYITNNSYIGYAYAKMIYSALLEQKEKVYILELGAGHGKLCYLIFKHLENMFSRDNEKIPNFCYVITDYVAENIVYWKNHPRLKEYFEKGWLDCAYYDVNKSNNINLEYSKKTINKQTITTPIIVVANYFFDSIPQELFYINNNKVAEVHVTEKNNGKEKLEEFDSSYTNVNIEQLPYKEDYLNSIIDDYKSKLNDAYVLFPFMGIRCLHQLRSFSKQGLMLLTLDKGYYRDEDVDQRAIPTLVHHGSFSLPVNYNAIKKYIENEKGEALLPLGISYSITFGCFMLGNHEEYSKTKNTYQNILENFGPDDYYSIKKYLENSWMSITCREFISVMKLSKYDSKLFYQLLPGLLSNIDEITENERWGLFQLSHKVWDLYYPLENSIDVAFAIGQLLFHLEFYTEAIIYFDLSIRIFKADEENVFAKALALSLIGNTVEAKTLLISNMGLFNDTAQVTELLNEL